MKKIKWADVTIHSRGDREREPASFRAECGDWNIVVSRWVHGEPDSWYLCIPGLCERKALKAKEAQAAQEEAVDFLYTRLWNAIQMIEMTYKKT